MIEILPELVSGYYRPGQWISRYARFRVDLPAGTHRLTGRTYNPPGDDLVNNRLQIVVRQAMIGEVEPAAPPKWREFSIDLPEIKDAETLFIVLRATLFRAPPPPDERLLGLLLDRLVVIVQTE
jgi:hypothetical protein